MKTRIPPMVAALLLGPACVLAAQAAGSAHGQGHGHAHGHHHPHPRAAPAADDAAVAAFLAQARAASARYHEQRQAILDGFRRLGPDFPGMGEHWVHPGRTVNGTLDIARPQALSYTSIDGRPVLTGVIYARPLGPGEAPPEFPLPGLPWHDHVGAIDEESVLLHQAMSAEASGFRLSMLHAWVWTENPDGLFAADNWALPFVRLGLAVPERIPVAAARALSLPVGGDAYHHLLFRALTQAGQARDEAALAELRRTRARVELWLDARQAPGAPPSEAELAMLACWWSEQWREITRGLDPRTADRLRLTLFP
jgi:hypothetical protein